MRKLTTLAITVIAAMAALAATAAPASADREFYVTDAFGGSCESGCYDTGYSGQFRYENAAGDLISTCTVDFDVYALNETGTIETDNTNIHSCSGSFQLASCDDSWPGQIRLPDTGPVKIDLEICLAGAGQLTFNTTFNALNSPRRWVQTAPAFDTGGTRQIDNGLFYDGNNNDDLQIHIG